MYFVWGTNDFVSVCISFKENIWKIGKDLDEKLKTYLLTGKIYWPLWFFAYN